MKPLRPRLALAVTGGLLVAASAAGVCLGPVQLDFAALLRTLLNLLPGIHLNGALDTLDQNVVMQIRLPRVVLAALVGALLAVSGVAYQGVFGNPLADPYLLGAAAGAGLGATMAIVLGHQMGWNPAVAMPVAAFVGAVLAVSASYLLGSAAAAQGGANVTMLLAGVAVAAFLTAAQTLVQQLNIDNLRQIYAWILGQLGTADWSTVLSVLPYAVVSLAILLASGRALDLLAVGEEEAAALGRDPRRVRLIILGAACLATASAVAVSGLIGFVGLVVPHLVRRLAGTSNRVVLMLSALGGAAFLVIADLVGRTLVAPAELPIGVVTAFIGAPFFAYLLRRSAM